MKVRTPHPFIPSRQPYEVNWMKLNQQGHGMEFCETNTDESSKVPLIRKTKEWSYPLTSRVQVTGVHFMP